MRLVRVKLSQEEPRELTPRIAWVALWLNKEAYRHRQLPGARLKG